jgi:hypothetical protein
MRLLGDTQALLTGRNMTSNLPAFGPGEVSFLEVVRSLKQVIHKAAIVVV